MISHNFAFVSDGHHRGNGVRKNKTVPDGSGNITFSTSLEFLYNQKKALEKRQQKNPKNKSLLLGVLNSEPGFDTLKKRFNAFGVFGKKAQNDPKKIESTDFEQVFLWGQNITKYQLGNIDNAMVALCRYFGDDKANYKNYEKSPQFKEALRQAKTTFMLVVASYDESFFSFDDNNPKTATFSLGYVNIGTGRKPIISSFERPMQDGLVQTVWNDEKAMNYVLDTQGSFSVATTKSYLANYNGQDFANLKWIDTDDGGFWSVTIASYTPDQLPADMVATIPEEIQEDMKTAHRIQFGYVMGPSDERVLGDILDFVDDPDNHRNALYVFSGRIDTDKIRHYTSEKDGEERLYITFDLRQGTFYNQRFLD